MDKRVYTVTLKGEYEYAIQVLAYKDIDVFDYCHKERQGDEIIKVSYKYLAFDLTI